MDSGPAVSLGQAETASGCHYERKANTLQTTALVNDVFLRLLDVKNVDWQQRAPFFAITAQMMRRILVDAAWARESEKRGGGALKVNVEEAALLSPERDSSLIALDDALTAAAVAPRQARLVELRYFDGMSEDEISEILNAPHNPARLGVRQNLVNARA